MNSLLRILHLSFDLPIAPFQLNQWRRAFNELGGSGQPLLHNHHADGSCAYRYPLVQYRNWRGKAALTAFNEGVEAVQEVLAEQDWGIIWEGEPMQLQVDGLSMREHYLRMSSAPKTYQLRKWLALNQDNYEAWQREKSLIKRAAFLERILAGQLLGFCTAMDYQLPERLEVCLQDIQRMRKVRLHGNPMIAFDVTYSANLILPAGMALGRGVSVGFGRLDWQRKRQPKRDTRPSGTAEVYSGDL